MPVPATEEERSRGGGGKMAIEEYKLTPAQIEWGNQYREFTRIHEMLMKGLEIKLSEADELRRLLRQAEAPMSALMKSAPKEPIDELPGQPVGEGEEEPPVMGEEPPAMEGGLPR